jgi:hypothetical protein
MRPIQYKTEEELIEKAVSILLKELGPVDTNRFMTMPQKKRMESVRRHREWQKSLSKEELFKELFTS